MIRPIEVDGAGWFPSTGAAAKIMGISFKAVAQRVASPKHPGWRESSVAPAGWRPPPTPYGGWRKALGIRAKGYAASVACVAEGVEYTSYQAASRALGIPSQMVRQRCHSTTKRFESWRFWDPKAKRWV